MSSAEGLIYKNIYPLTMAPGIVRDGTKFSRPNWSAGQWTRFYRGVPQKIGGYKQIPTTGTRADTETTPRGLFVLPNSSQFDVYVGTANDVGYTPIDFFGNPLGPYISRKPAGFADNNANSWQFDVMFSNNADNAVIIGTAAPNLTAIDSSIQRPIYYGKINSNDPLITTGFNVSGGIVVLSPYLLMLDNNGRVIISQASDPTTELFSGSIAPYKLLAGLPVRGGNTSPAGLIWSLDRLIRVTQVGTDAAPEWNFDTVSAAISVMSASCMVEYDSVYFWMGVDRWYFYDGVCRELVNNMNKKFVFENLNYAQRQKVWATKVTEWGEIWWFYPSTNSTECDRVVMYSVLDKTWIDTALNRSCGYYASSFAQPIWADNMPTAGSYPIWLQEEGVDINIQGTLSPLFSSIKSGTVSNVGSDPNKQRRGMDRWMSIYRFEPDFVQTGDMQLMIHFQDYAQSVPNYTSGPYTFSPDTVKIDTDKPRQGREIEFEFISNVVGGNYEMGENLFVATIGDGRQSVPGQ